MLSDSLLEHAEWYLKRSKRGWQFAKNGAIGQHYLLKLRHMNRMNSAVRRQFQFVSHFPNLVKDGIGSKVFESQLVVRSMHN